MNQDKKTAVIIDILKVTPYTTQSEKYTELAKDLAKLKPDTLFILKQAVNLSPYDLACKLTSKEVLDLVMTHVNNFSNPNKICKEVETEIPHWHPTLQQNFGRFIRAAVLTFASATHYDDRNQGTVEMCKAMKPIADKAALPFI